jgi:hypothetical protein
LWSATVSLIITEYNSDAIKEIERMKLGSLERLRSKRGVPIGIYRDQRGALENKRKPAYFCYPELPVPLLSDPIK